MKTSDKIFPAGQFTQRKGIKQEDWMDLCKTLDWVVSYVYIVYSRIFHSWFSSKLILTPNFLFFYNEYEPY